MSIIIRRTVATIEATDDPSAEPMLVAAFKACADELAIDHAPFEMSFEYEGYTYRAGRDALVQSTDDYPNPPRKAKPRRAPTRSGL